MNKQLDCHQQVAHNLLNDLEESIVTRQIAVKRHSVSWRGWLGDRLRGLGHYNRNSCGDAGTVLAGTVLGGVYLHGGVGRGKTMLMDAFFVGLDNSFDDKSSTVKRFHYHDFMQLIHASFHVQRKDQSLQGVVIGKTLDEVLGKCCSLLCLDEMEVTDITDAMLMSRLFKEMIARRVTFVITSNMALNDLYKDGLQRDLFVPFIEMMEAYVQSLFLGRDHDYRSDSGETTSWFCGSEKATRASLKSLYDGWQTSGCENGLCVSLASRGRFIEAKYRENNKVWFDFSALCGEPLGSRDFIKLANTFRYMVIEGMPKAGHLRIDMLRRFVVLVDVLYDESVEIGISSTQEKEKVDVQTYLQREDGDRYGLSRAASRLQEML